MNILSFHHVNENVGDSVIYEGAINLLEKAIGSSNNYTIVFPERNNLTIVTTSLNHQILLLEEQETLQKIAVDADILLIPGSPWIGIDFTKTSKYSNIMELLKLLPPKTKKIAIGLGSAMPLKSNPFPTCKKDNTQEFYSNFSLIRTRDKLAANILKEAEISSNSFALCPSFFSLPKQIPNAILNRPVLIYIDSTTSIASSWASSEFINNHHNYQISLIEKYNPKVITITEKEKLKLKGLNIESVHINNPTELYNELAGAEWCISGRIHAAIPAALLNIPTTLLAIDSRYRTAAEHSSIKVLFPNMYSMNLENIIPNVDYSFANVILDQEKRYIEDLRKVIL